MNPFKDDKAPYVVALLLGALGWHASQITDQIREARSVSYDVNDDGPQALQTIHLENISSDKYLSDLDFEVNCQFDEECIDTKQISAKAVAPTVIEPKVKVSPTDAGFSLYLPANSAIDIVVGVRAGQHFPRFHYTPKPGLQDGIVLLPANSWRVFVAKNYLKIITYSFIMIAAVLLLALYFSMVAEPSGATTQKGVRRNRKPKTEVP